MAGWIKISRDIVNHWLWQDAERLKWWFDLLLMAAWEDRQTMHDAHLFTLRRGQMVASVSYLSDRWGKSHPTIIRFLKMLEDEGMIYRQTLYRQTPIITICNYDKYQVAFDTQVDTLIYTQIDGQVDTQVYTNKENKEDKEVKPLKENQEKKTTKMQFELAKYGEGWDALIGQWLAYKSSRRQSYKSQASVDILFKKLQNLSSGDLEKARMIVEQSIGNNWSGLFPLKDVGFGGGQNPMPGREVIGQNFENRD